MELLFSNLNDFFTKALGDLNCHPYTRAYLINLYAGYHKTTHDLSQDNLTLLFLKARTNNDFYLLQQCADWIFYLQTMWPEQKTSTAYYQDIARLSYYSCYKIINRQLPLYIELADNFIILENQAKEKLSGIKI